MYTMVFGFLWGMTTAYLGVGWFDGNLINALISNLFPIAAVSISEHRRTFKN